MAKIEKTVFISYRRTNFYHAWSIRENLVQHNFDVFLDYTNIDSGDFEQVILNNIASRAHFLVLLTPSALERVNQKGDWLRREIEYAIETKRNIVPVTMEDFNWEKAKEKYLTGKLSTLGNYSALRVPTDFFTEAMERLRKRYLNVPIDAVLHPRSVQAEQVARKAKKRVDAKAKSEPTAKQSTLTAETLFESGYELGENDQFDEALKVYTQVLKLKSNFPEALHNRGIIYGKKGRHTNAIQDFDEAIRIRTNYEAAYFNRGIAHLIKGNTTQAISDLTAAIHLNANHEAAYFNRGMAYKAKNQIEKAISDFTEAIRIKPDYSIAYHQRGILKRKQNKVNEAIADFTKAIRHQAKFAEAHYYRGLAYKAKDDWVAAIDDYTRAIKLRSNYFEAFNSRGIAKKMNNDLQGAIKDYRQAKKIKPDDPYSYNNLGSVYYQMKEYKKAEDNWEIALTKDPSFKEAKKNLRILRKKLNKPPE